MFVFLILAGSAVVKVPFQASVKIQWDSNTEILSGWF